MNDENKRITKFPICQFYIVLGHHDREFKNNKENKFFPIRGNEDIELIQYAVTEEYKKKKKEGYAVAGEIIFLVPNLKYKDLAFKLMELLNFKGRVKIVPPLKQEEPKQKPPKQTVQQPQVKQPEPVTPVVEKTPVIEEVKEAPVAKEIPQEKITENKVKEEKIISPQPQPVIKKEEITDAETYMWGDTKPNAIKAKSKKKRREPKRITFDKPKKSKAFIDLPVLVFILSALFLIGSIVLLFIWK